MFKIDGLIVLYQEGALERVIAENRKRLQSAFERKQDRPTGFQVVPQHLSICDIQARVGLKGDDIFDVAQMSLPISPSSISLLVVPKVMNVSRERILLSKTCRHIAHSMKM